MFRVAPAGGQTPRRRYQLRAEPPFRQEVGWSHVEFFWGGERPVPPGHAASNGRMARAAMLDTLAAVLEGPRNPIVYSSQ
jgi:6-phosphogluconolactonase